MMTGKAAQAYRPAAGRDGNKDRGANVRGGKQKADVSGLTVIQTLCCNLAVSLLATTQDPERPRPDAQAA